MFFKLIIYTLFSKQTKRGPGYYSLKDDLLEKMKKPRSKLGLLESTTSRFSLEKKDNFPGNRCFS